MVKSEEMQDAMNYKQGVQCEIENEMCLKDDIQVICQRYKKLIFEQKKDKEKLKQLLCQQNKQIKTLEKRKEQLELDNDKILQDFNQVV